MTETLGFDCSYDYLTVEEAQCLWDSGYRVAMQCGWTGAETPAARDSNLKMLTDQGFRTALYISLPSNAQPGTGQYHMLKGFAGIPSEILQKIHLTVVDVELPGIHSQAIREAITFLRNGYDVALYTSYNTWKNYVRFDTGYGENSFTDTLLINAFWAYSHLPDRVGHWAQYPYGTWGVQKLLAEQYTGDTPDCGQELDRSVWDLSLLGEEPEMPMPIPTIETRQRAVGVIALVATKVAAKIALTDADIAALIFTANSLKAVGF